ncbi:hypothetical protein Peur_028663 [Populus x canadensis]
MILLSIRIQELHLMRGSKSWQQLGDPVKLGPSSHWSTAFARSFITSILSRQSLQDTSDAELPKVTRKRRLRERNGAVL